MVAPLLPKNGRYLEDPHIGHLYSIVVADTMTRWQRFMGHEAFFMTGTDEHGLKIQTSAAKKNIPAREFCDLVSGRFRDLVEKSNSKADDFIRTTEDRHVRAVTELWKVLKDRGFIYKGSHEGWYSTSDESEDSLAPPCCAKPHCFRLANTCSLFCGDPDNAQRKWRPRVCGNWELGGVGQRGELQVCPLQVSRSDQKLDNGEPQRDLPKVQDQLPPEHGEK